MADDRFVYVTYIRTTQEKLWTALREPEFTRQYFFGVTLESEWKPEAPWRMVGSDGKVTDSGKVLEIDPPHRLVLSWQNEFRPELKAEGYSRATFDLETQGDMVKLTVVHEIGKQGSKLIEAVSGGWPIILSSLKSLLETGKPMERKPPK
ncbi:MAG TPA: SRPBCC family protein [Micropepsaceae bacterium]|nr:SRPBCC family protein [Micropepsaceae bacterium]